MRTLKGLGALLVLLLLGLFVLVPLVGAFLISVQRTDGFGSGTFAGLANYARLA